MSATMSQMSSAVTQLAGNVAANVGAKGAKSKNAIGFCSKCGSPIEYGCQFCTSCGTPVPKGMIEEAEAAKKEAEERARLEEEQRLAKERERQEEVARAEAEKIANAAAENTGTAQDGVVNTNNTEQSALLKSEDHPLFCQQCGAKLDPDAAFCVVCGTKVE